MAEVVWILAQKLIILCLLEIDLKTDLVLSNLLFKPLDLEDANGVTKGRTKEQKIRDNIGGVQIMILLTGIYF